MNLRLLLIPGVFFAVGVLTSVFGASGESRTTGLGLTVALSFSILAMVVIFETVRSKVSKARTDALLVHVPIQTPRLRVDPTAEAVMAISRADSHFTPARVTAHVEALYLAMQHAARDGRLDDVHPWMSDGLFQRLSTQARLLGAVVGHELLSGYGGPATVIAGAVASETYQSLTTRVTVAPLDESKAHAAQTQTWLFLRRLSVTTQAHGLADGRCPNCGAPLKLTATQRCAHCQAVVNSGQHDWVLSDISPGATTLARKSELLDLDGLRAKDPSLSPEELTDRAVLAFWRWYEVAAGGDARRLTRITTERFRESARDSFAARELAGVRVTVGGADVRRLGLKGELEQASVVVWWSAGDGDARQTVLQLVRPRARAATPQGTGLASSRCEGCLAPMTDAETPACEYCGRPFSDTWRLDEMESFAAWSEQMRLVRNQLGTRAVGWNTVPRHERLCALQLAAAVARADGKVTDSERTLLDRLAGEWGLEADAVEHALRSETPATAAGLALPRAFARELLRQLVELVFVDGRADLPERKLVERVAASLGVQDEARKLITQRVDALMKQLMR